MRRPVVMVVTLLALGMAGGAEARTFTVTERDDPDPGRCTKRHCTLREAVIRANVHPGADRIGLPSGRRYELARPSTSEDAGLDGDLDVTSGPLTVFSVGDRRAVIDANRTDRAFDIDSARTTLQNLVVRGGSADGVDGDGDGGGILASGDKSVSIRDSKLVANRTTLADGNGGAVDTDLFAPMKIRKTVVIRNVAVGEAGGVGGSIDGPTRLDRVLIRNNEGGEGGGVLAVGEVTITGSTIADNRSVSGPDGELGDGGGIYVDDQGVLSVQNSTIAGNFAIRSGAGVYGEPAAVATLSSSTIARNRADSDDAGEGTSGGVHAEAASFELANSIIALNTATAGAASDCGGGTYGGAAPNLISSAAGGCGPGSEIVAADPLLGPLAGNGGPTPTIALLPGSPAIGAADPALSPERDQRGTPRDDGDPDLGAFEL